MWLADSNIKDDFSWIPSLRFDSLAGIPDDLDHRPGHWERRTPVRRDLADARGVARCG